MTPEGKTQLSEVLQAYGARIDTLIEDGQDIRFVKLVVSGRSEDPINALDSAGYMVHSEEPLKEQLARNLGRPLLHVLAAYNFPSRGQNIWQLEDVASERRSNTIKPDRGYATANDRASYKPSPQHLEATRSIYPPGHPSLTGQKI